MTDYADVVVVGASIAGCTAARLFALTGAHVTLLEKRPDPDAFKVVCTHYVQPSAVPTIRRLGLAEPLEAAGAAPAMIDVWTRYGWIDWQDPEHHGYNIRRRALDPLLRHLTAETPGVTFRPGHAVHAVVDDGRVRGVRTRSADGAAGTVRARLVVAADGRDSRVARLAGVPARRRRHGRFAYFAYFAGVDLPRGDHAQMWLLDPDIAYVFPGDDGIVCVAAFFAGGADRLAEVRADPGAHVRALYEQLPDAPDPWRGTQTSRWIGKVDMENQRRPAAARGMAFAGDAALSSDPVWGVGCGYAFQSAEWLVDATAGALHGSDAELDRALDDYRRTHRRRLGGHHWMTADYSGGRRFNPVEKLLFRAAAHDPDFAAQFERFGSREVTPDRFLPTGLVRAAAVEVRHAVGAR